ncbi:MAG: tetratricopeptide repeat protein, partial [Planctomycetota bacterium]
MTGFQQKRLVSEAKRAIGSGRFAEARDLCERAVKKDRNDVDAHELLGVLALEQGLFDEAARRFRKCVSLRPRERRYTYRLGQVLHDQGRVREAIDKFDAVLRAGADPHAALSKAAALERIGAYEDARATLQPAADDGTLTPSGTGLWSRLLLQSGEHDAAIDALRRRLEGPPLRPRDRQTLLFALGRAYEKAGEYDGAFEACREANEIDKPEFDSAAYVKLIDRVIATFSEPLAARLARAKDRSGLPVVVAGMPRSGTTLVEQIVAAHPKAAGGGELVHLPRKLASLQMELD